MKLEDQITEALIVEVRRRLLEESLPRIKKCLNLLTEEQIWWRPNIESNSIGNLVLHLNGNVRQWIITGVGGDSDIRNRNKEFDTQGKISGDELLNTLSNAMSEIESVLNDITAEKILVQRPVQIYTESVLTILIHVTEHFSYHTGQIAWITKMLTEKQLGFYEGVEL